METVDQILLYAYQNHKLQTVVDITNTLVTEVARLITTQEKQGREVSLTRRSVPIKKDDQKESVRSKH